MSVGLRPGFALVQDGQDQLGVSLVVAADADQRVALLAPLGGEAAPTRHVPAAPQDISKHARDSNTNFDVVSLEGNTRFFKVAMFSLQ